MKKAVRYTAEEADLAADGKHVRLITRYVGRYSNLRNPRHIETLTEQQARQLHEDLGEVLDDL